MIVDFQHHYTPAELMERGTDIGALRLDEDGNPNYRFNPLLADLPAHVRMMDRAGIDVAVLSCGTGFDQPDSRPSGRSGAEACVAVRRARGAGCGRAVRHNTD
jgi:hypothetical protein